MKFGYAYPLVIATHAHPPTCRSIYRHRHRYHRHSSGSACIHRRKELPARLGLEASADKHPGAIAATSSAGNPPHQPVPHPRGSPGNSVYRRYPLRRPGGPARCPDHRCAAGWMPRICAQGRPSVQRIKHSLHEGTHWGSAQYAYVDMYEDLPSKATNHLSKPRLPDHLGIYKIRQHIVTSQMKKSEK